MGIVVQQLGSFADAQESCTQTAKRSDIGSADMKGLRFDDAQESRFQGWKLSFMRTAVCQGGRFPDVQELHFKSATPSHKGCAELQGCLLLISEMAFSGCETFRNGQCRPQGGWFAETQESRFQAANRTNMSNSILQGG